MGIEAISRGAGRVIWVESLGSSCWTIRQNLEALGIDAEGVVQQKAGPVAGTQAPGGIRLSHPSDPFEQAADIGFADRKRPEDQSAVGDRFIAGYTGATLQRA